MIAYQDTNLMILGIDDPDKVRLLVQLEVDRESVSNTQRGS